MRLSAVTGGRAMMAAVSHDAGSRAVLDDPDYRARVFAKLRPTALPGFGTVVECRLAQDDSLVECE